jgi:nicotinate phosphoribosyltransferase
VVTGGFNPDKISRFEQLNVPADIYGVGSSLIRNGRTTNTDFTADVVRIKVDGEWVDLAKVGRQAADNPNMQPVDLSNL